MHSAILPMAICTAAYGVLSYMNPIRHVDNAVMSLLSSQFTLSWWLLLPAALVIVLPLCRVNIKLVMVITIIASFVLAIVIQHIDFVTCLRYMVFGYVCPDAELGKILNGGGMTSMVLVCAILALSCSYSGIFRTTRMLNRVQHLVIRLMHTGSAVSRRHSSPSAAMVILFCNQTIAAVMTVNMVERAYTMCGRTRTELAIDIEKLSNRCRRHHSLVTRRSSMLSGHERRRIYHPVRILSIPDTAVLDIHEKFRFK